MRESKPVAIWARIGAGFVAAMGAIVFLGLLVLFLSGRGLPDWRWYQWLLYSWAAVDVLPVFLAVALKGRTPSGYVPFG